MQKERQQNGSVADGYRPSDTAPATTTSRPRYCQTYCHVRAACCWWKPKFMSYVVHCLFRDVGRRGSCSGGGQAALALSAAKSSRTVAPTNLELRRTQHTQWV